LGGTMAGWDKRQPLVALALAELTRDIDITALAPPARRRQRKLTLSAALRQAAKAGASVARVEIVGDKTTLVMGDPDPAGEGTNPWLVGLEGMKQ
jgi:hypothetical protein